MLAAWKLFLATDYREVRCPRSGHLGGVFLEVRVVYVASASVLWLPGSHVDLRRGLAVVAVHRVLTYLFFASLFREEPGKYAN
jgi:hypothetical protein